MSVEKSNTYESRIVEATCSHFGFTVEALTAPVKIGDKRMNYCKKICAYILREYTLLSYSMIAEKLGYKNRQSAFGFYAEVGTTLTIYKQTAYDVKKIVEVAII